MLEKGYESVKVKNFWTNKGNPYNGINCTFKTPDGQRFEVQFHTQKVTVSKMGCIRIMRHGVYWIQYLTKQGPLEKKDDGAVPGNGDPSIY